MQKYSKDLNIRKNFRLLFINFFDYYNLFYVELKNNLKRQGNINISSGAYIYLIYQNGPINEKRLVSLLKYVTWYITKYIKCISQISK